MHYRGSCHCGNIAFEVEGELEAVISCNCSLCQRRGSLLWAMPHENVRQLGSGNAVGTYTFGNRALLHRFCHICGIHPYAEDAASKDGRNAYINVRCLEGVEPDAVEHIPFDGRSV